MDKSPLTVAALVVGILGLLIGLVAYLGGKKAGQKAENALLAAEDAAPTDKQMKQQVLEVLDIEIKKTEGKLTQMLDGLESRIKDLEKQASKAEIIAEAKSYAMKNAEEGSAQLYGQVNKLREEIKDGDGKAIEKVGELRTEIDAKLKETREMLKRLVIRWMESGAM